MRSAAFKIWSIQFGYYNVSETPPVMRATRLGESVTRSSGISTSLARS
ncbi:hypothetical protein PF003_g1483 [Phytophthora fragariae]|nr:hypothetical protein PF003_g1483 [Phytophthora fragariae]